MDKLKYILIFVIIYIIYRVFFSKYENLTNSPTPTPETPPPIIANVNSFTPTPTTATTSAGLNNLIPINSIPNLLADPTRTISIVVGTESGNITIPCTGRCNNCVINSVTPTSCSVIEKV